MTDIAVYIGQIATLGAFTWASVWALSLRLNRDMKPGPARKWTKRIIAYVIGPIAAIVAYGQGFLRTPGEDIGAWGFAAAAVFGFLGTIGASAAHAKLKGKASG